MTEAGELRAVAKRIPNYCDWSTGTGTKRSHAQILAPSVRRESFYAVADSEAEALSKAVSELEAFVCSKGTSHG